jgi:hypothetical protein
MKPAPYRLQIFTYCTTCAWLGVAIAAAKRAMADVIIARAVMRAMTRRVALMEVHMVVVSKLLLISGCRRARVRV